MQIEPILVWHLTGVARKEGLSCLGPFHALKQRRTAPLGTSTRDALGEVKANVGYLVRSIDRRGEIAEARNVRCRNHAAAEALPIISGLPASSRTWAAKVIG